MRILILGGTGMLGHALWRAWRDRHEVWVTSRSEYSRWESLGIYDRERFLGRVEATDDDALVKAMAIARPSAVVNCVGIIKQLKEAHDPFLSISINSLLPHRVARFCAAIGARLIHISTDCVFSGRDGQYTESSIADAEDLYGRTKYLGEVGTRGAVTLRTSIIGRELETRSGLVEWFLGSRGSVRGYTGAIYSGLTTLELARVIERVLSEHPLLTGVYQVSSDRITKYDLLLLLRDAFGISVMVEADDEIRIDRSLDSARFRRETGYTPTNWPAMIAELGSDRAFYDRWRSQRVA